jgi:hypothetical protein
MVGIVPCLFWKTPKEWKKLHLGKGRSEKPMRGRVKKGWAAWVSEP